jgi:hypothetical protein
MSRTNSETVQMLASLSTDCSFLLTHLVRQKDRRNTEDAKEILKAILDLDGSEGTPLLRATKVGWFGTATSANVFNPVTGQFDGKTQAKAVCLTDSTLAGLKAHRDVFESHYGIAFDRDVLFQKGANPCLNIRDDIFRYSLVHNGDQSSRHLYNFIPEQLQPFINIIQKNFDATHEREWRVPNDMKFSLSEVMFIFCPESEFCEFAHLQSNGRPVLFDLVWLNRV